MELFVLIAVIVLILIMWFSIKPAFPDDDENSAEKTVDAKERRQKKP